MKRVFLVYDDKDFAEWIEEELSDYGRIIRSTEGLDFFFSQWNAIGSPADLIILPETVISTQESFMNIYSTVKVDSQETMFLLIYHRDRDSFIENLMAEGNVCISFNELDTGILEQRLLQSIKPFHRFQATTPVASQSQIAIPQAIANEQSFAVEEGMRDDGLDSVKDNPAPFVSSENEHHNKQSYKEITFEYPEGLGQQSSAIQEAKEANQLGEEKSVLKKQPKKRSSVEERQAKLQRIKERIIIEERIVTVHVPVHHDSKMVSIVSMYPRAGATFVTSNLARMLGENKVPVAVLEPVSGERGSTYYELMYGEKNAPKEWVSWAKQIKLNGAVRHENSWIADGVVWIPSDVDPMTGWTEEQTMQLLLAAKRYPVTLCDISSHYNDVTSKKIMDLSDEIWIVADGDPVQLGLHYKNIDSLKETYPNKPMKVIGNKWSSHVKQAEWKEAVLLPLLTQVPDLGSVVTKHMWDGKMAWDDSKLKNTLAAPLKPLARTVMAKEMYKQLKKHYGFMVSIKSLIARMGTFGDESKGL